MQKLSDKEQIKNVYDHLEEIMGGRYLYYDRENIYVALLSYLDKLETENRDFIKYKSNYLETASKYNIIKNSFK